MRLSSGLPVVLHMIYAPTTDNIERCAKVLRDGGVVGMPTETVYGLAASIHAEEGLAKIFALKGRPADNPLIVHVASVNEACSLTDAQHHEILQRVAAAWWPGPLTCVVPASDAVSMRVTAGLGTVAVRMPDHPVALALIHAVGSPVAAPSANRSGRPSPTTAQHVIDDLGYDVDVLDGGPCTVGVESTVVRLSSEHCTVLRPGGVSIDELQRVLGMPVEIASDAKDLRASPGTRYRHYAPSCSVVLCSTEDELRAKAVAAESSLMVLATHAMADLPERVICALLSEPTLYAELRRADDLQLGGILVLCDHTVLRRDALMNRLLKAASASEKHL